MVLPDTMQVQIVRTFFSNFIDKFGRVRTVLNWKGPVIPIRVCVFVCKTFSILRSKHVPVGYRQPTLRLLKSEIYNT